MSTSESRLGNKRVSKWTPAVGDTVYHGKYGRGQVKEKRLAGYQLLVEFVGDVRRQRWVVVRDLSSSPVNATSSQDAILERRESHSLVAGLAEPQLLTDGEEIAPNCHSRHTLISAPAEERSEKPDCIACEKPTVVIKKMLFEKTASLPIIDFIHMLSGLCKQDCLWRQHYPFQGWDEKTVAGMLSKNGQHYYMMGHEILVVTDVCFSSESPLEECGKDKKNKDCQKQWLALPSGTRFIHPRHGEGFIRELWAKQGFYRVRYDKEHIDRLLWIYELQRLGANGTPIEILASSLSPSSNVKDSDIDCPRDAEERSCPSSDERVVNDKGDSKQIEIVTETDRLPATNSQQEVCEVEDCSLTSPDLSCAKVHADNDQEGANFSQGKELPRDSQENLTAKSDPISSFSPATDSATLFGVNTPTDNIQITSAESENTNEDDQISRPAEWPPQPWTTPRYPLDESETHEQASIDENARNCVTRQSDPSDEGIPDLDEDFIHEEETIDTSFMGLIDHFELSKNAKNILKQNVSSIHELIELDREKLKAFPDCGKKTIEEILDLVQTIDPEVVANLSTSMPRCDGSFDDRIVILAHDPPSEETLNLLPIFSSKRIEYFSEDDLHSGYNGNTNISDLPEFGRLRKMLNAMGFTRLGSLLLAVESDLMEHRYFLRSDLKRVRMVIRDLLLGGSQIESLQSPYRGAVPGFGKADQSKKSRLGSSAIPQPPRSIGDAQRARVTEVSSMPAQDSAKILSDSSSTEHGFTTKSCEAEKQNLKERCGQCERLCEILQEMALNNIDQISFTGFISDVNRTCEKHCSLKWFERPAIDRDFLTRLLERNDGLYIIIGQDSGDIQIVRSSCVQKLDEKKDRICDASSLKSSPRLKAGTTCLHPRYGKGIVQKVHHRGNDFLIKFDQEKFERWVHISEFWEDNGKNSLRDGLPAKKESSASPEAPHSDTFSGASKSTTGSISCVRIFEEKEEQYVLNAGEELRESGDTAPDVHIRRKRHSKINI